MKYLDILRAQRAAIEETRAAAVAVLDVVAAKALDEKRSFTADEDAQVEQARSSVAAIDAADGELAKINERIGELEQVESRTAEIAKRPALQVIQTPDPNDVLNDRQASSSQIVDAVTRSAEARGTDLTQLRMVLKRHQSDRAWASGLLARSTDEYLSAFKKYVTGREMFLTPEERAAITVATATAGGLLVPTHLDPTLIFTSAGTSNVIRSISRVVTLTNGNVWHGVTTAGATASWDGEVVEVSDDTPAVAAASITTYKAQALVQASIEAMEDIDGLAGDVAMILNDAKDVLEGTAHATGTGSQPQGIFATLASGSNIVSTTAAAIGLVDLDALYVGVPVRFRGNSTWVMNPKWSLAIKDLGTAVSASFSGDLTQAPAGRLLGKTLVESDDAPAVVTTTVKDAEIVLGDFSNFVIVDKPGSAAIEFIPNLFNTANNLPDGRRAWYMHWRTGSDSVNDNAFRLLQDKTSA